ncbi:hypothetical protein C6341_g1 [Phytophthora cactorum]|nr:hypothetical protein C6341_g1 [Phytophthora cactorum]
MTGSEKRSILQAYAEYEQFEQNENIHRERRELAVMIYRNIHAEFGRAGVQIVVISALIKPCKSSIKDSKAKMSGALALGLSLEKGIVLLANKEIHPGDFIIQYTGEVITHDRITARVMCVCIPNCEMQKWDVNGDSCCGLFGKVPIPRGEEVTFASTPPKSKATRNVRECH